MAIQLEDLTTGVNWEWREVGIPLDEVDIGTRAPGSTTTRTFTLRHDSDDAVIIRGFYLSPIESLSDYVPFQEDWPDKSPAKDIETLLYWGDQFNSGLYLVQGVTATLFQAGVGSSIAYLMPCTLGSDGAGRVDTGAFITIGVRLVAPTELLKVESINTNIKIAYRRIPA